jgi:hypothetical protein
MVMGEYDCSDDGNCGGGSDSKFIIQKIIQAVQDISKFIVD